MLSNLEVSNYELLYPLSILASSEVFLSAWADGLL